MPKFVVIDNLLHGGLERQPGDELDLDDDAQAERLIDEGRIAKPGSKDAKAAKAEADSDDDE